MHHRAVLARTAFNIRVGAKHRTSGILNSVFLGVLALAVFGVRAAAAAVTPLAHLVGAARWRRRPPPIHQLVDATGGEKTQTATVDPNRFGVNPPFSCFARARVYVSCCVRVLPHYVFACTS